MKQVSSRSIAATVTSILARLLIGLTPAVGAFITILLILRIPPAAITLGYFVTAISAAAALLLGSVVLVLLYFSRVEATANQKLKILTEAMTARYKARLDAEASIQKSWSTPTNSRTLGPESTASKAG